MGESKSLKIPLQTTSRPIDDGGDNFFQQINFLQ